MSYSQYRMVSRAMLRVDVGFYVVPSRSVWLTNDTDRSSIWGLRSVWNANWPQGFSVPCRLCILYQPS